MDYSKDDWKSPITAVNEVKEHLTKIIDKRIVAYYTGNIQESRDEESLRLLKKIADIEIEDYSSHILEQIRITWETWNSPRLSSDSLYLDEIEEMNLNIQEG
ncbi:hypothetical protein Gotur_013622 [Gossypium turneri]